MEEDFRKSQELCELNETQSDHLSGYSMLVILLVQPVVNCSDDHMVEIFLKCGLELDWQETVVENKPTTHFPRS